MTDPFRRLTAGDPLSALSATAWNALMEVARWWTRNRGRVENLPVESDPLGPSARVYVRNDTGGDLAERSVVGLSTPPIDPTAAPHDAQRTPLFSGIEPTADGVVAVIEGPLADGATGRAVIQGVAVVGLDVIDAGHGYCGPTAGETGFLTTAETGPIRILWKESGTGSKLGIVLLQETASTLVTANADGSEESSTRRLEFDQDTYIGVTAGATDADPDVVALDVEGLTDEAVEAVEGALTYTVDVQNLECLTILLVPTYAATQLGGEDVLTAVTPRVFAKKRTYTHLTNTIVGEMPVACTEITGCCPPVWYCDDGTCVEVDIAAGEEPPEGATGPFASEEDCEGECYEVVASACCPDDGVPNPLTLTVSGGNGSFPVAHSGGNWDTGEVTLTGGGSINFRMYCLGSSPTGWSVQPGGGGSLPSDYALTSITYLTRQCDPFLIVFTATLVGTGPLNGSTLTFTVTL